MHLEALSYHVRVRDHFRQHTKTWDFFSLDKTKTEQLKEFRTELLKNTYQFDEASYPKIYQSVQTAKEKLGLEKLKVTVYQAQYSDELNASVLFIGEEALIVFSGRISQLLDDTELLAVIAHELTHIKLFTLLGGDLEVADRIISSIANNYNSEAPYLETAKRFRLYNEIFCDRGACLVLGETSPVITSLVKTATGLNKVNAQSYVRQAEEIFASDATTHTANLTHPENFIRARALQLWFDKKEGAEQDIMRMIEGIADLDRLDIFRQQELTSLTLNLLKLFLKPQWFRSTMVISQAKQYFTDFSFDEQAVLQPSFSDLVGSSHQSVKEYLAYVLLDFALLDPRLEEVPFGWAFQFAEDIQLKEVFDEIVKKELKLSEKKLQQHRKKMLGAFYEVKEGEGEQIYEG